MYVNLEAVHSTYSAVILEIMPATKIRGYLHHNQAMLHVPYWEEKQRRNLYACLFFKGSAL